jgi:dienelactone hydrolase
VRRFLFPLVSLLVYGLAAAAQAAPVPLAVEETFFSVDIQGKPYRLQARVAKEPGRTGRLPVALITHGQNLEPAALANLDKTGYATLVREFARRGWLAVMVVRRGFGKSQGPTPYALRGCRNGDYADVLDEQTDDISAAFSAIARRQDADMTRVVGIGASVGGAVMLNLAARAPAGLQAVINISGGVTSRPADGSNRPTSCQPKDLPPVFAAYGKRSRIPTLWLYAENDSLFPADYVRGMHDAYVAGGGVSEFHMFAPLKVDGHDLYVAPEGIQQWLPVADDFLRARKWPSFDPAPLDAALKAALPVPAANYFSKLYNARPTEKALSLAPSGKQGFISYGRPTLEQAAKDSLEGCNKQGPRPCRVVLQNFDVIPAP